METNIANLVSWCVDGPTTLHGYDDDLVYILVEADTEDPELQRQVRWCRHGILKANVTPR